jgi:hypothetical protein
MSDDPVNRRVAAAALFIGHATCIAQAGKHQTVGDTSDLVLVAGDPSEGADRAKYEQEAMAVARTKHLDMACQHRRDGDPREVVIRERWVADMAGKEDGIVGFRPGSAARHS